MDLSKSVGKQVCLDLKHPLLMVGYDKKMTVAPLIRKGKQNGQEIEMPIQMPFLIGTLRQDEGSNDYWVEFPDQSGSGAMMRVDVAADTIAYCTSLLSEPSRLIT